MTLKTILLQNPSSPSTFVQLKYCDSFISKFLGLMLTRELALDQGIMMVEKTESKVNTSIHMMFMNYDLTVLWLDKHMVIVDKVLARKWAPYYAPKEPAQYVVELHPSLFPKYSVGDMLVITSR